ncbi:histidine decarboxylase [Actinomadura rubrisoli]|nr:histidine decarboxylase [Actinomadura rubrisoli]
MNSREHDDYATEGMPPPLSPDSGDLKITDGPAPGAGRSDDELLRRIAEWGIERRQWLVGFPVNLDFDYRPLADFLAVSLNNVGSPYTPSGYQMSTKPFERAVLDFFAGVAGAEPGEVEGYITNGGTESNIFGVRLGIRRYPDAVFYASADAHYSVDKFAALFSMDVTKVDVGADGGMDIEALADACRRHPGRPAVVLATVGTTMTGAADDVAAIRPALRRAGVERLHLHVDGAFGGLIVPFIDGYGPWAFDAGADSVAVSGHKMIGLPVPSGIVLARREQLEGVRHYLPQVDTDDHTLTGSRNGLNPLLIWWALRRLGRDGLAERARHCLDIAEYAERLLAAGGAEPRRCPHSVIVSFDRPSERVLRDWHLLDSGDRTHFVAMPHITRDHVERLCRDLGGARR